MFNKIFRYKLFLNGFWLLLVLILILSLCSIGFTQEKVKLTWSEWWDEEWGVENVDWIISSFEEKHPNVEIVKLYTPYTAYYDKLMTLCVAGEAPDVMAMEVLWAVAFDKLGVLEDLDPLLVKDRDFRAKFSDSSLLQWKGKTRLIFLYAMSYHFVYNVKMFEEKGIEPPTDWEELKDVLRTLREPEKGRYGLALQLSLTEPSHPVLRLFYTPLIQFGGRLLDEDGWAVFNSDAGIKVLEYWKSLIDEDLVYPDSLGMTEPSMYEMMAGETLPMFLIGPWVQSVCRLRNPEIQLAYCPPFKDVTTGYVAVGSGIGLSAVSEHKDMAWEFMKHLWSDEVALKMTKVISIPWATRTAFEAPFIEEDPILRYQPAMIGDPASQPLPILPEANDLFRVLAENMQAYFLGEKDARTALDDAAEYWNKVIAEY